MIPLCLAALLTFAALAAESSPLPQSLKATYKVTRNGLPIGQTEETFERFGEQGDRYRIVSNTRAEGAVALLYRNRLTYTSEGRILASGLQPLAFSSTQSNHVERNFSARFDWMQHVLIRQQNQQSESFDLPEGAQDRLSSMYQFMAAPPKSTAVVAWMTQGRKTEQYTYVKQGEPLVQTPAGAFATVHYARDSKPGETKAELWLARDSRFIPVKIAFTDTRGARFEQTLAELAWQ